MGAFITYGLVLTIICVLYGFYNARLAAYFSKTHQPIMFAGHMLISWACCFLGVYIFSETLRGILASGIIQSILE
jgi:hypothetical protein